MKKGSFSTTPENLIADGDFECLAYVPMGVARSAGLALAADAGGAIPVFDFEWAELANVTPVKANWHHFETYRRGGSPFAFRLSEDTVGAWLKSFEWSVFPPLWLILYDWTPGGLVALRESGILAEVRLLLEVRSGADWEQPDLNEESFDGLVVKGNEAGGWVGGESAFVLSQKAVLGTRKPCYVQGGVGLHSAAACRTLGASGVVLDDHLWSFPESPLRGRIETIAERVDDKDSVVLGDSLGAACRVLLRPDLFGAQRLRAVAEEIESVEISESSARRERWRSEASKLLGIGDEREQALPAGATFLLGRSYAARFRSVGRLIQAIKEQSRRDAESAVTQKALNPGSPLALDHGTRYPIVQGPMTRVSDRAEFADALASAGGLPMLALALMSPAKVQALLESTRGLIGSKPWGVGLLGFAPKELLDAQMACVVASKPSFALLAGGRPTQVRELEAEGIPTYLHAPVPGLLERFLEQGARRFVLEGRECGGHVGPLSSFVLWERAIEVLLRYASRKDAEPVSVLFAGGIHDGLSAAMVAAMAAPLVERGVRIGVLMGTPYLFARETVESGAIVQAFQDEALRCLRTTVIETSPGHQIRCSESPFTSEFQTTRRQWLIEKRESGKIREGLEALSLGRLRLASKGLERDAEGNLIEVNKVRQQTSGMYMLGDTATMHGEAYSMEDLHREVSEGSSRWAERLGLGRVRVQREVASKPSQIAIVGMSAFLPGAGTVDRYWRNLLDQKGAMSEVPKDRWDWRLYYQDLKAGDARDLDRTVSKWGGFIEEVAFDPIRYGIPPKSLKRISPAQLLALEVVSRTITDAGYNLEELDRENTSIIFGTDGNSTLKGHYIFRTLLPLFSTREDGIEDRLPEWGEEAFPGILANVTPGRVTNRFDFGGTNFVVDAACASSLKAVDLAVQELESGRSDCVLVGGVDIDQSPEAYVAFSSSQALSPTGRVRTFDRSADGIVISEGIAVVMLKRLEDAERDGDRIYALIQGAGSSSDGKALGLTAPNTAGQQRAFRRAYTRSGIDPRTVGYYEAHGTGTVLGDRTELQSFQTLLRSSGAGPASCVVGSHKSLIGHTKTAAGLAGLIKASLSLHHRVLSPHFGVDSPIDALAEAESPVVIQQQPIPWLGGSEKRRSGVSAFGFGGTNTHIVLEEYDRSPRAVDFGARDWPVELYLFHGAEEFRLKRELESLCVVLDAKGSSLRPADVAWTLAEDFERNRTANVRLAIVAKDLEELAGRLRTTLDQLAKPASERRFPPRVVFTSDPVKPRKVGLVFPGQGAQYLHMGRECSLYLRELRETLELADASLRDAFPVPLSRRIFPPTVFTEEGLVAQRKALTDTHVAQVAIGTVSIGLHAVLKRLEVPIAAVCGHSYGEFAALHAGGACSTEAFLALSEARGRCMAEASRLGGKMLVVFTSRDAIEPILAGAKGELCLSNHNAPEQVVLSGSAEAIDQAVSDLEERGIRYRRLNVAGPFHSKWMEPARGPLDEAIDAVEWASPSVEVYSNLDGARYPSEPAAIRERLGRHLLHSVEFVAEIEQMSRDGVDVFIECGPNNLFSRLIERILPDQAPLSVALDRDEGSLEGFLGALAQLQVAGLVPRPTALFEDRDVQRLDFASLKTEPEPRERLLWYVDGAGCRPAEEPHKHPGKCAPLDYDESQKLIQARQNLMSSQKSSNGVHPSAHQTSAANGATNGASRGEHLPSTHARSAVRGAASSSEALAAFESYQQTMRQFLQMEERLMLRFLGDAAPATAPSGHSGTHEKNGVDGPVNGHLPMVPNGTTPPAGPVAPAEVSPASEGNSSEARIPTVEAADRQHKEAGPMDRDSLKARLLELVSDRTGYPESMLEMDSDLESELGIDSIKRIEILSKVMDFFPVAYKERLNERFEHFTQLKTLDAILDEVGASLDALRENDNRELPKVVVREVSHAASVPVKIEIAEGGEETASCPLAVMVERVESLSAPFEELSKNGVYVITEGRPGWAEQMAAVLEASGLRCALFSSDDLFDREKLAARITALRSEEGAIAGLLHFGGTGSFDGKEGIEAWKRRGKREVKSLFHLLQLCREDLCAAANAQGGHVFSISAFDGRFGRGDVPDGSSPLAGASVGLLKTLATEWTELPLRAIDFPSSAEPAEVARKVFEELRSPSQEIEVGYAGEQRLVFEAERIEVESWKASEDVVRDRSGWVVVATGGARGITAEILKRYAAPGMKLILVGRSAWEENEASEWDGFEDPRALREALIGRLRETESAVTPVQVEARHKAVLQARERRNALAKLKAAGAQVEYHALDVANESAMEVFLTSVYDRYGRIDAVLHGAGVLEDKLLVDKKPESFDRVFDVKADSAFLLGRHLRPEGLKEIVFFSSIAGRFGNRGQADYAAANEVLNRIAWRLQKAWPKTRVLSINWGPWASVGMAVDPGIAAQFAAQGIVPIETEEGCRAVLTLLEDRFSRGVPEVVAGQGNWLRDPVLQD